MKITQAQYFEIEEFFTKNCKLVETDFIKEMTDHFIDAIESKLTESFPFDKAMDLTIKDFGGLGAIQKMEWQFRMGFMKKQIRVLWALEKSQFAGIKLLRTAIVSAAITALCLYLGFFTKNVADSYDFLSGLISGASIVPVLTLPIFLLQRYVKWLRVFGVIKSQMVVRVYVTYALFVISALSSYALTESGFTVLASALLNAVIWSILSISFISLIEYSQKYEGNYWYSTK
ncbi:hypothetical protein [Dyadobacter sp. CY356]|uniref:hypothetical protein n=1 Tax=Dyadobacter sp. CY356 TaxID=2906442 RepID=UPI001F3B989F|nr:hypothetical protein [Dyadobacter sp. CY356]MCF0056056.1 hypothetical protein [Dyadobacter sp. CY356]